MADIVRATNATIGSLGYQALPLARRAMAPTTPIRGRKKNRTELANNNARTSATSSAAKSFETALNTFCENPTSAPSAFEVLNRTPNVEVAIGTGFAKAFAPFELPVKALCSVNASLKPVSSATFVSVSPSGFAFAKLLARISVCTGSAALPIRNASSKSAFAALAMICTSGGNGVADPAGNPDVPINTCRNGLDPIKTPRQIPIKGGLHTSFAINFVCAHFDFILTPTPSPPAAPVIHTYPPVHSVGDQPTR
mmetsp:Transcript_2617/g.9165  ORF Transcript_2617/g.9165 Transcript_2617/m.9165 type:complete len:253 (+) Transcript_2617:365-1123(+)